MNEPDDTPKTQSSAGGGPPRPPKVTARGLEGDDQPEGEISPEMMLKDLNLFGWLTDDELAAVRRDPSVTAERALELLLLQGTITQSHIETIQKSFANTEYIPLTRRD
ncbi:MAG TPA: hypothetical protein VK633_15775 [Verrucomicrobiae bacterium]|nr:hypothetical protein [Verrucomicrobiae bacterium]